MIILKAMLGRTTSTAAAPVKNKGALLTPRSRWKTTGTERYAHIDFAPPQGVQDEARKGLEYRRQHGRGGTAVGVARARDLSGGKNISPSTARRMSSYFARHTVDKKGENWGNASDPSAGYVAWLLWGGDAGESWAAKLCRQLDAAEEA